MASFQVDFNRSTTTKAGPRYQLNQTQKRPLWSLLCFWRSAGFLRGSCQKTKQLCVAADGFRPSGASNVFSRFFRFSGDLAKEKDVDGHQFFWLAGSAPPASAPPGGITCSPAASLAERRPVAPPSGCRFTNSRSTMRRSPTG